MRFQMAWLLRWAARQTRCAQVGLENNRDEKGIGENATVKDGNGRLNYPGAVKFLHDRFGMIDVTHRTLRTAVARRQLTASVRGSVVRFHTGWLIAWAERQTRTAYTDRQ